MIQPQRSVFQTCHLTSRRARRLTHNEEDISICQSLRSRLGTEGAEPKQSALNVSHPRRACAPREVRSARRPRLCTASHYLSQQAASVPGGHSVPCCRSALFTARCPQQRIGHSALSTAAYWSQRVVHSALFTAHCSQRVVRDERLGLRRAIAAAPPCDRGNMHLQRWTLTRPRRRTRRCRLGLRSARRAPTGPDVGGVGTGWRRDEMGLCGMGRDGYKMWWDEPWIGQEGAAGLGRWVMDRWAQASLAKRMGTACGGWNGDGRSVSVSNKWGGPNGTPSGTDPNRGCDSSESQRPLTA